MYIIKNYIKNYKALSNTLLEVKAEALLDAVADTI